MSIVIQGGIVVFGCTAVYLSQDASAERRRWSSIAGLLGQPFWFLSAYAAHQWGVFAICLFYTFSWARGFYNNWLKDLG